MPSEPGTLPFVSVIIPTYNRKESLLRTLDSLSRQTYPAERFEVIVVDNGGNDGTEAALQQTPYPYNLRYFRQPHLGVGAARQVGLSEAKGELLLYLDDDMVAEPDVIMEHVRSHREKTGAVVKGRVILALDASQSVFSAIQSGSSDLPGLPKEGLHPISYQQVFAGHFSIRRCDALLVGGWSDESRNYGFQDLEFMYRCYRQGLKMWYVPQAVTYHHDYATTLAKACDRMRQASQNAATHLFVQHPELRNEIPMFRDKGPIAWREDPPALILRKLARQVVSSRPTMWAMEHAVPFLERHAPGSKLLVLLYRWIISGYIYRGYREGLRALQK
jgi:glycosyltransferase involved in cell wall biosynthesis